MQSFLPYPDFAEGARVLDDKRLPKQIVECAQILDVICGFKSGWKNHPAVKQWIGYPLRLHAYAKAMHVEWLTRGHQPHKSFAHCGSCITMSCSDMLDDIPPPWLGDPRLHASHRSNLLRKDPVHYGQLGWTESPDLPYFWPSKDPKYSGIPLDT